MYNKCFTDIENSFEFLDKTTSVNELGNYNYLVKTSPVEIHMHGIGNYDFSEFEKGDLEGIQNLLNQKNIYAVITGFLRKEKVEDFRDYMQYFISEKIKGNLENILGVALEGPLLSTTGGTPPPTTWLPSKRNWEKILNNTCGYLKYVVFSPDAILPGGQFYKPLEDKYPSLQWLVNKFYENNVMPSLGHFRKDNSNLSVDSILQVCEMAKMTGNYVPGRILVDHLFNDMPRNIIHAWRTKEEKEKKTLDLKTMDLENWSVENLDKVLGAVPSILIKLAIKGEINICLNFDGEHVALEIAKKIAEIMNYEGIIVMTDCASDTDVICSFQLTRSNANSLLYQEGGVVAAGTTNIDGQIFNMRKIGISEKNIWRMVGFIPLKILLDKNQLQKINFTYVNENGDRLKHELLEVR